MFFHSLFSNKAANFYEDRVNYLNRYRDWKKLDVNLYAIQNFKNILIAVILQKLIYSLYITVSGIHKYSFCKKVVNSESLLGDGNQLRSLVQKYP